MKGFSATRYHSLARRKATVDEIMAGSYLRNAYVLKTYGAGAFDRPHDEIEATLLMDDIYAKFEQAMTRQAGAGGKGKRRR